MPIYEKWVKNNTERIQTTRNPDSVKLEKMGTDYLLVVEPPTLNPAINKKGDYSFTATERSWEVVPLSQEELDVLATAAAQALTLEEAVADFLGGPFSFATKTEAIEYVNANIDSALYPGINLICKKLASNLVSINTILRLKFGVSE